MLLAILKPAAGVPGISLRALELLLLKLAFFNLLLVSLLGVALRSYGVASMPLSYKNLLHGHSHFAFAGWIMPLFMWLIIRYFPLVSHRVGLLHWRNIVFINFFSAYGMLLSFPFQGYGLISILFSTISMFTGIYMAIILWRACAGLHTTAVYFLKAGLMCIWVSAIGPLATGPLIAMGMQGTPVYYNAVYFYLHFQYNGWFTFFILGLLYTVIERNRSVNNGRKVFWLMVACCGPAYFLSILWSQPHKLFYVLGGLAATGQLIAIFYFVKDLGYFMERNPFLKKLLLLASGIFIVKNILQLLSAFPYVADLAYQNRELVIAYLHFVLLGFISLMAIYFVMKNIGVINNKFKVALVFFLLFFMLTEALLIVKPFGYHMGLTINFPLVILLASCVFPVSVFMMQRQIIRYKYPVEATAN